MNTSEETSPQRSRQKQSNDLRNQQFYINYTLGEEKLWQLVQFEHMQ